MNKKTFGLIGKNISYSFSVPYFEEKFKKLGLTDCEYLNFDLQNIEEFAKVLEQYPSLKGCNVTIPYKQDIFTFLDETDRVAREIGAVNTLKFSKNNTIKGYNTDVYGFETSLTPLLKPHYKKALILGSGGASKAIAYIFKKLQIAYLFVSRTGRKNQITYKDINEKIIKMYPIIVNCTPLGTYPATEKYPDIPYHFLDETHLLYDLIYNPSETRFLNMGKNQGATVKNGLEMLQLQAEKSWKIWNS